MWVQIKKIQGACVCVCVSECVRVLMPWYLLCDVGPARHMGGFGHHGREWVGMDKQLGTTRVTSSEKLNIYISMNTYRHQIGGVPAGDQGGADDGGKVAGRGPGGVLRDLVEWWVGGWIGWLVDWWSGGLSGGLVGWLVD